MKGHFFLILVFIVFGCGTKSKITSSDKTETGIYFTDQSLIDSTKISIFEEGKDSETAKEKIVTVTEFEPVVITGFSGEKKVFVVPKSQTKTTTRETNKIEDHKTDYNKEVGKSVTDQALVEQEKKDVNVKGGPAKDPKRWRYIFYILVVLVGVGVWIKVKKVFKFAKK